MERDDFLRLLDGLMELPEGTLKGPEPLDSLETWNSLALMELIALVDEHYGVTVSPRQFLKCTTVNDLLTLTGTPK